MSKAVRWGGLGVAGLLVGLVLTGWLLRGGGDARLVDVTGVERAVLERGDVLGIVGVGFHAGRVAEVRLRGVMRRPGMAPASIKVVLPGRAIGTERVEVRLDEAAYAKLGQRGSFDGAIEVRFEAARGARAVSGALAQTQFDILPSAGSTSDEHRLRERAQQMLARLGVSAADADTLSGLTLARVQLDSPAERAALRAGDVIVSAAGLRVHALSDLAGSERCSKLALLVKRQGLGSALPVSLDFAASDAPSETRLPVLLSFVLLTLLFASPLPSPTFVLLRVGSALRGVRAAGVAQVASIGTRRERAREVAAWGGSVFVLLAACVSSGSADLGMIVAQQGAAPWLWKAFSHPELLAGFVLYMGLAARVLEAAHGRWVAWTLRGLLAALAASVFLGGHSAPLQFEGVTASALGWLSFSLKAALLAWLMPRLRALGVAHSLLSLAAWCLGIATVTAGWLLVEDVRALEGLLGRTLALTALLSAVVVALQARAAALRALLDHGRKEAL